ncbi:MAG: DUF4097 family beta strand repeat-containing protein [Eubacteriales bacterium]|nr:DUF4097 family beta strand repeat-containing protein [Eubacteriales bacterium]
MKKGWKIFWIICGIVLGVGIVFCMAGRFLGATFDEVEAVVGDGITLGNGNIVKLWELHDFVDWDSSDWDSVDWEDDMNYEYGECDDEPDSRDSYQEIHKLDIDVGGVELQILPSDDEDIHVVTKGISSKLKYSCKQDGDTLDIKTTTKLHLINRIRHGAIWVYLPERTLEEVDISNAAGIIYVDTVNAREFKIDLEAGECTVDDFTARDADLECGAGEITASGTVLQQMDVECGVGEIDLTILGDEADFSYEIECGVGDVTIGEHHYSGIGFEQSGQYEDESEHHEDESEHHEEKQNGNKKLSVDCGLGDVCVEFVQ